MSIISEFIEYLKNQVNKSIYVWGAQGQLLTNISPAWIRARETSPIHAQRAINLYEARKNIPGARALDCSGLGMFFLQNEKGILKTDMTADGLMHKCTMISKADLKPGDFVFKINGNGKATHIGYVVSGSGASCRVVEAQGRAYGVVERSLSEGGWNRYGRPTFWASEKKVENVINKTEAVNAAIETSGGTCEVTVKVVKSGVKGECVKTVQRLLNDLVNAGLTVDGSCGSKTTAAIKKFQKAKKLTQDGHCGPATWNKLVNG